MFILPLLLACGEGPPADLDITDPAVWLLAHLQDDPDEVAARIERLGQFALGVVPEAPPLDRAFLPAVPTEEQLSDLPHEAGGPALYGVALAGRSDQEMDDHRALISQPDRRCLEGSSYTTWTRTLNDQGSCFAAGACDEAASDDDVVQTWGVPSFRHALRWEWRAVELLDGREAYAARSWQPVAATPSRANDVLQQSYAIEVVLPDADDSGATWKVHARWIAASFAEPSPVVDGAVGDQLVTDLDDAMTRQDAWLAGAPACD